MTNKDFAILFWGPNHCGYTYNLDNAGVYTEEDCKKHIGDDRDPAIMCDVVDPLKEKYLIDYSPDMVTAKAGHIVKNDQKNRKTLNIKKIDLPKVSVTGWDHRAFKSVEDFKKDFSNYQKIAEQIL